MRVLHINRNYLTTALHQTMVEHLESLGASCCVFAPTAKEDQAVIVPNANVTKCACFSRWERPFYRIKQGKITKQIKKSYDMSQFDLIHASTVFTDGNSACRIHKKYGTPYIVAVRDTDLNFFRLRVDLRRRGLEILRNASSIVFLSEGYMNKLLDLYIPTNMQTSLREKARIIPNGIDDFWLDNKYTSDRHESIKRMNQMSLRVIYAGRITKNKNIELTQESLELLRKKGWDCAFTFIGKVYDVSTYQSILKYPNTKYIEPRKKEELIEYYRDADIFVMPSHHETFGLVYAEAMSQGLPVIYTRGQGFDGQFEEGEVGYSVSDSDATELSGKILKIANGYSRFSRNACELVDKFRWGEICEKYMDLYKSLAKT